MVFGDDLKGELFKKIGAEGSENPLQLLELADEKKKAGNVMEATKMYQQVVEITAQYAQRYVQQSQHRATAEQYYIQALAYEKLDQNDKKEQNYDKVIESLLAYAKSAIAFNENSKGITSATLAGLVSIMAGNETRAFDIYQSHIQIAETKPDVGYLKNLLYSLGYLIDAIKNTNMTALSTAQNFISKDLSPMLSSAKLEGFNPLLQSIITYTQSKLESKIKMPVLKLTDNNPRDLMYNESFELIITIHNEGNGDSNRLEFNLEVPKDLEILEGKTDIKFEKLIPNETKEIRYMLRYQSGQTQVQAKKEIKGTLVYYDMLSNSHKQFLGTIELEFNEIRKSDDLKHKLTKLSDEFNEIKNKPKSETQLNSLIKPIESFNMDIQNQVKKYVDENNFELAEFGLELIDKLNKWTVQFYEGETSDAITFEIENKIDKAKSETEKTVTDKLTKEHQETLQKTKEDHEKSLQEKLDAMKMNLEDQHSKQMNSLKSDHQKEIDNMKLVEDNKIRKALTDYEDELKDKHTKELRTQKEELENAITDLQKDHQKELENTRAELEQNLTHRLNQDKKEELETQKQDLERELNSKHEDEKEKLNTYHKEEIRKLKLRIDELEQKLRDYESSNKN